MQYVHAIVHVLIPFISSVVAEQQLNPLSSPMEERRLEEVLSNLRSEVKKRRLLMYPYYRDYDMVGGRGGEGRLLMYPYYRDYDMVGGRGGRRGDEREREGREGRGGREESTYVHRVWNICQCECVVAGGLLEGVRELYIWCTYLSSKQNMYDSEV